MSRRLAFLTVEHLIAIHDRMIAEFGGERGLRDRGLLESAAAMPAARFGKRYLHEGFGAKAAAYLFHLCKNHPFLDGNKRTALTAAEMFIRLNGRKLAATNKQLERLTVGVSNGDISKDQVIDFFRARVAE